MKISWNIELLRFHLLFYAEDWFYNLYITNQSIIRTCMFNMQVILPAMEGSFIGAHWLAEDGWTPCLSNAFGHFCKCVEKETIRFEGFIISRYGDIWCVWVGKKYHKRDVTLDMSFFSLFKSNLYSWIWEDMESKFCPERSVCIYVCVCVSLTSSLHHFNKFYTT